jgi:hypothetical protein
VTPNVGRLMLLIMTHNLLIEFLTWTLMNPLHGLEDSITKMMLLEM